MKTKEAMQQLALMGIYTSDAEPPIFKMIREKEEDIKNLKRNIAVAKKYHQSVEEMEKDLREYETTLKAYKNIAKLAPTKDEEPIYTKGTKDAKNNNGDDTMTSREAREYWNKYHNTDPVLEDYKTFEEWYRESKQNGYIKDESRVQYVEFKTKEGGREGQEKAREKEAELKRQHKEVKLVSASPMMTYFKWEVKDADINSEYNAEIERLERKKEQLRRMGQGRQALEIDKQIEKLQKELRDYNRDDDATEHGSVEEYGKNKETESMPLEKDPTLAQDSPSQERLQRLNNLHVYEKLKEIAEENMKRYKPDHPEYKRLADLSKKYDQEIKKWSKDEDKFGTVMKEFYEGKLKSSSGEKVTDPQQAKAIAYSETKDSALEELELRLAQLEHERNIDESVMGYKPDKRKEDLINQLKKQIKELKEKKRTQDSMEVLRLCGFATDAEETWITMNGTHVKIEEGQSKGEAAKNFISKKGGNPAPAKSKETGTAKATASKSFQEKGRTGTPKPQSKEELDKWRETLETEHEISDPDEWDAPASYKKSYAKALAYPPGSTFTDKSGKVHTIEGYMDNDGEGIMVEFEDGSFMDAKNLPSTGNEESLLTKKSNATSEHEKNYESDFRKVAEENIKDNLLWEVGVGKKNNDPERIERAIEAAKKIGFDKELRELSNKSKEEFEKAEREQLHKVTKGDEELRKKYSKVQFDPKFKKKLKKNQFKGFEEFNWYG